MSSGNNSNKDNKKGFQGGIFIFLIVWIPNLQISRYSEKIPRGFDGRQPKTHTLYYVPRLD